MANKFLFLRAVNSPFVGNAADITKNSVLSHSDVDNNFIFLKGEDILTGSTSGSDLILNKVNSDKITIDLSSISGGGGNVDYGNIIFVSESGNTTETRTNVIGNINKPVSIERASQIAQNGDTIHVKSGIFNVTTTGNTGLCVSGVNHYFEPNSKVYKTTTGPMFGKAAGSTQSNVYGSGSFYGSGSCGYIFQNNGSEGSGYTQVYEWDICENISTGCTISVSNENIILKGKRSIVSSGGAAITITDNSGAIKANTSIDCPLIKSTVAQGILQSSLSGGTSNAAKLTVNADDIIGASDTLGGLHMDTNPDGLMCTVNANYINYICNLRIKENKNLILDVARIDEILNFNGTHLKVNGHLGWLKANNASSELQFGGVADIALIDRCWLAGTGTINTTLNGDFNYTGDTYGIANPGGGATLVSALAGAITANYKLQTSIKESGPFQYKFVEGWFFSNAGGTMNMLGNWDIQNFWYTHASGRLNIPSGTVINIGPTNPIGTPGFGSKGETFNFAGVDVNIGGTIVERCDPSAPCDTSQSAHTYSNTLMFVNNWGESGLPLSSTRVVYNGATIIVRDQNSQILTTSATGGTVGIYSGGLNTNKMNSFEAEKEKIRVSVTGTSASLTVNSETYTSTTGGTAAASAFELTTLINASTGATATASQDTPGTDEYIYIESDVAGTPLSVTYGTNTLLLATIRYNTKAITDSVGGMLIEDEDIIKDQYN
tara:strand:+ start:2968 stop:5127 length:2160 start_codon:yes stop_codon:yes gene_type:complete